MTRMTRALGRGLAAAAVTFGALLVAAGGCADGGGWSGGGFGSRSNPGDPSARPSDAVALNAAPAGSGNDRISYERPATRPPARSGATNSVPRGGATANDGPMMRVEERDPAADAQPRGTTGAAPANRSGRTDQRPADGSRMAPTAAGARASSSAGGDTVRQVLAFPTGLRDTSVLLLEKTGPRQVHLDRPFTYELRVTNLTDYILSDVVVEEIAPDALDLRPASGNTAAARPATAPAGAMAVPAHADPRLDATLDEADRAVRAAARLVTTQPTTGPTTRASDLASSAGPATRPADRAARDERDARPASDTSRNDRTAGNRHEGGERFVIGELGPRQSRTVTVNAVASRVGPAATCTSVSYRPMLCSVTQVIHPVLRLTKSGPDQAHICDDITYRYTVANTGTGTARGVTVRETLPPGLTSDGGSQGIMLEVGDLPEGTSRDFNVPVRAAKPGEYASRATAAMAGNDEPVRSDDLRTVVKAGRLQVSVSAPETEYVNKVVNFPVFVKNEGDGEARDVVLDVRADGGGDLIGFSTNAGGVRTAAAARAAPGVVRQNLGTIPPGQTARADVSVRARAGGDLKLTATARAGCIQPATGIASTTVKTLPALLLEVVDREDPVRVGESTVYRIVVKNQGTGPDQDVKITATLPDSETFVRAAGSSEGRADGRTVTFAPVPNLAPGQTATWEVEVKADKADDARFQIDLTSRSLTKPVTENESTRIY